jgi:hypothetical protein
MEYVKVEGTDFMPFVNVSRFIGGVLESRSEEYSFYTIGKSAYLDKGDSYNNGRKIINGLMMFFARDSYISLLTALEGHLKEEVYLDDDLAYPGFHIFDNDPAFLQIAGNWHTDEPHNTLGLGDDDVSTFTLAIQMPEGGGGIDFYSVNKGGVRGPMAYVPHKEGYMIVHSGQKMHRIASFKEEGKKSRITLQGHIVRRREGPMKGKLVAFW